MRATPNQPSVGDLLRTWRQRRRLSQLSLATEAEISARHLCFVETGRAKPSRELLLHLAEQLEIPLRERNALLLSAGFAPIYQETPLEANVMAPVRAALDQILAGHLPFPAVVVNLRWDLVAANETAMGLIVKYVSPELLQPPINALRVTLHPKGLSSRILNFSEYSAHLLTRLQRQAASSGDPRLTALYDELKKYPGVGAASHTLEPASMVFTPLRLRSHDNDELTLFSTIATFGTALDLTLSELAIESFFPGDKKTEAAFRALQSLRA